MIGHQIIFRSVCVSTKMRSLAGSLADGVLAGAILIPSHTPIPPTNMRKGSGRRISTKTSNRKTFLLVKEKKRDIGIAKRFSKKYRN